MLSRGVDDSIVITVPGRDDRIVITVSQISGSKTRLAIDAPKDIQIFRKEIEDNANSYRLRNRTRAK